MTIVYEGCFSNPTYDGVRLNDPAAVAELVEAAQRRAFEAERNAGQMFDTLTAVQESSTRLLERARAAEAELEAHIHGERTEQAREPWAASSYLRALQADHKEWSTRNFPNADPIDAVLGVAEEVGELCHAILKQRQGIRGTKEEHEAKAKDAVGDIVIFLLDVCNRRGWSFAEIVAETWAEVRKRDWTKK